MASISDLEREVRMLRNRLTKAENAPAARERAEAEAIVSGGDAHRRGSFSRVCQEANETRLTRLLNTARNEMIDNPRLVDDEGLLNNFRNRYKGQGVLSAAIEDLIDQTRKVVHPPPSYENEP